MAEEIVLLGTIGIDGNGAKRKAHSLSGRVRNGPLLGRRRHGGSEGRLPATEGSPAVSSAPGAPLPETLPADPRRRRRGLRLPRGYLLMRTSGRQPEAAEDRLPALGH